MDIRTKIEIDKMNALFERMNGHYTQLEAEAINEGIEELDARGILFSAPKVEHDYPHCWRCSTPLLYYERNPEG